MHFGKTLMDVRQHLRDINNRVSELERVVDVCTQSLNKNQQFHEFLVIFEVLQGYKLKASLRSTVKIKPKKFSRTRDISIPHFTHFSGIVHIYKQFSVLNY